jgi:hypothetical protein
MPYKYENGKWTYVAESSSSTSRPSTTTNTGSSNSSNNSNIPTTITQTPPSENDNRETTETKTLSDTEYIEVEENILEGNCKITPNPKIHAKGTVKITGVGTQLTGLYYVEKSTHSFSSSGYEQELTVTREGFGDSIKKGNVSKPTVSNVASNGRPEPVQPTEEPKYILINRWGTVTPDIGLNVRTSPQIASNNKIGAMTCGTRVFCIGKKGDWYDHKWGGQTAWSHGDYIRLD